MPGRPQASSTRFGDGVLKISDLNLISELRDSLDWDAVNHDKLPEMTLELVGALARVGALQPSEERLLGFGLLQGKGWMADDFDGPLPDDLQANFDGRHPDPLLDDPI